MKKGDKHNRLTAIKFIRRNKRSVPFWLFGCDCGTKKVINAYYVKYGDTKSCGCLSTEIKRRLAKIMGQNTATHGLYRGVPIHSSGISLVYKCMVQRCNDKSMHSYKNYGGRGIKCLWKSFAEFKKDMEPSYRYHIKKYGKKDTEIDRIDNNGNYSKENCRWSTRKENSRNRRVSIFINGVQLGNLADKMGVRSSLLYMRTRSGWSLDDIMKSSYYETDKFQHRDKIKHNKEKLELTLNIMKEFKQSVDKIEIYLGTLDDREQDIIRMRFGLIDGKKSTLEEVGSKYGITRERVRQIEDRAVKKITKTQEILHT